MNLLIRGGRLVLGRAGARRYECGDLLIEDGRIAAVGGDLAHDPRAAGAERIEAGRMIAMPGLINAHLHSNEAFEPGAYDNLPLERWLIESYSPFGFPILKPRDHYLRAMAAALQSIRAGVTTVQDDIVYPPSTPDAVDEAMKAYRDAGLRAWVTTDLWDRPFRDCLPYARETFPADLLAELDRLPMPSAAEQIALFERHYAAWNGHDGRLRIILAPCGPQRCTEALLAEVGRISAARDVPIHSHTLETRLQAVHAKHAHNRTWVAYLDDLGLLTPRTTLVHGIWLTRADIERLGARGCSVVHNPLSNLKLGSGVAKLRRLIDAGVNVALGTDGLTTSDTADMTVALRLASLLHKIGDPDPSTWVSAEEAFDMATIGGARSSRMDAEVGSLEIGKRADVILIDADSWGFVPAVNPIRQLAFAGAAEAVRTVVIEGRVVMRDRRIVTVDEAALKAEFAAAAARFWRDDVPKMRAGAARLRPYMAALHRRATAESATLAELEETT